jgi:Cd2+/Zn2+-exporting ATPase
VTQWLCLPHDVLAVAAAIEARDRSTTSGERSWLAPVTEVAARKPVLSRRCPAWASREQSAGEPWVGNLALMKARTVAMPVDDKTLRRDGHTLVFVAVDSVLLGAIAIADPIRDTAVETLDLLRSHGVRHVAMLTGDHDATARVVASALSLDEYHADLLPAQKHDRVLALREAHGPVLMVGDGVNDAPALAAADVGAAMGAAGSDAALETADIALMSDELLKIPYALRLARATVRNVKTNVVVSLVLKAAFLILAITGSATLWMAVLADTGASVIVVANALRLLRQR